MSKLNRQVSYAGQWATLGRQVSEVNSDPLSQAPSSLMSLPPEEATHKQNDPNGEFVNYAEVVSIGRDAVANAEF